MNTPTTKKRQIPLFLVFALICAGLGALGQDAFSVSAICPPTSVFVVEDSTPDAGAPFRLSPEPPAAAPSAETTTTKPMLSPRPDGLVGEWIAVNGKPLPTLKVVKGRPGSKTEFNLEYRQEKSTTAAPFVYLGCGFDDVFAEVGTARAFCKVFREHGQTTPESVESSMFFERNLQGEVSLVIFDLLASEFFKRKPDTNAPASTVP